MSLTLPGTGSLVHPARTPSAASTSLYQGARPLTCGEFVCRALFGHNESAGKCAPIISCWSIMIRNSMTLTFGPRGISLSILCAVQEVSLNRLKRANMRGYCLTVDLPISCLQRVAGRTRCFEAVLLGSRNQTLTKYTLGWLEGCVYLLAGRLELR